MIQVTNADPTKRRLAVANDVASPLCCRLRPSRDTELETVVVGACGTDEVFANAVFRASLAKIDTVVARNDLGFHES